MSLELRDPQGGVDNSTLQHVAGASYTLNVQHNEYHGDVTNHQHNYFGGHYPGWKATRRCAGIDLERLSKHFCGRDQELEQIHNALKAGEGSLRCAIHGISGLGKSHLAIKYGKVSYESGKYVHAFWISVDTEVKLLNGLESVLVNLDHPAQSEGDQKTKVGIARRWMEDADEDQRWLLILDNARRESFAVVRDNLPKKTPHGHILITTQFNDIAEEFVKSQSNPLSHLRLQPLAVDDGVTLLIASSRMSSDSFSDEDREKARQLVQRTGCHPLAITFAAACATSTGTLPDLLDWTSDDQLMMITEHEDALAESDQRVIKLFFDRQVASIQNELPALELFRVISFLDGSSISVNMLWRGIQSENKRLTVPTTEGDSSNVELDTSPSILSEKQCHEGQRPSPFLGFRLPHLQKHIKKLASQNLVQVASPGIVTMHDLTNHLSIQTMLDLDVSSQYQNYASRLISSSFASIVEPTLPERWLESDEVMPHIFKLTSSRKGFDSALCTSLYKSADYLQDRGRYSESEILYDRLLTFQEKDHTSTGSVNSTTKDLRTYAYESLDRFRKAEGHVPDDDKGHPGPKHISTHTIRQNLALVYQSQGRFREAEELLRDVLNEVRMQLGPTHVFTLTTTHNLALVYNSQGRFREAAQLLKDVLKQHTKQSGLAHLDTLTTMNHLAVVIQPLNCLEEAEELYQHVLDERKKQLGSTHQDTLETMHNLASLYILQGRFQESRKLLQHVVDEEKVQIGPTHPHTLTMMENLAGVIQSQGYFREAEERFQHVLAERKKQLGSTHPDTLRAIHNLASVSEAQGRFREAIESYQHVLDERKKQLGLTHPDTLTTIHNIAGVHESQGRHREAEELYQLVLDEEKTQLGLTHPVTLATMQNMAGVYESQGRYREAEKLYQHVSGERKRQIGPTHTDTLATMCRLAHVCRLQGRYREAGNLFQQVLDERKKQLGPNHPHTLSTMHYLADVYKARAHYREAEGLYQHLLNERKKQLGPTHPYTLITMLDLVHVLKSQGRLREAEELFQQVFEERQKQSGSTNPAALSTVQNLAAINK